MYSHIIRSQTRTLFGTIRYCLTAQILATRDELHLIAHSRLGNMQVFRDPLTDAHAAAADAAHQEAKKRGLFVTKARDASAIAGAEMRSIIATMRAVRTFDIHISDLIDGVMIQHKSLQAITEIEAAITKCIDDLDRFLSAARNYTHVTEDIFAPGADEAPGVPPAQWTCGWRR